MLGYIPFWAKLKPTSALAVYYLEWTTAIATRRLMAAMMYNIAAKYIQDPWTVPLSPWLVLSAMSQQRPSPLMTECLSRPRVMEGPSHSILASVLRSIPTWHKQCWLWFRWYAQHLFQCCGTLHSCCVIPAYWAGQSYYQIMDATEQSNWQSQHINFNCASLNMLVDIHSRLLGKLVYLECDCIFYTWSAKARSVSEMVFGRVRDWP